MFEYKIHKKNLEDGIKLIISGKKNHIKHNFTTKVTYKELENVSYSNFVKNMIKGLEKKIDLLLLNNI